MGWVAPITNYPGRSCHRPTTPALSGGRPSKEFVLSEPCPTSFDGNSSLSMMTAGLRGRRMRGGGSWRLPNKKRTPQPRLADMPTISRVAPQPSHHMFANSLGSGEVRGFLFNRVGVTEGCLRSGWKKEAWTRRSERRSSEDHRSETCATNRGHGPGEVSRGVRSRGGACFRVWREGGEPCRH